MKLSELEKKIYDVFLKNILKEDADTGKKYVLEEDFDKIVNTNTAKKMLQPLLDKLSIEVKKDVRTKEDRSPLVRDHNFGEYMGYDMDDRDVPSYAEYEYNDDTMEEIYAKYDKLIEIIENKILSEIQWKRNRKTDEIFPSVQLNKIVKLCASDKEEKFIIDYLKRMEVHVCGIDSSIDASLENYDYYRTYKSKSYGEHKLTKEESLEKFSKLREMEKEDSIVMEYKELFQKVYVTIDDKDVATGTKYKYLKIADDIDYVQQRIKELEKNLIVKKYKNLRNELIIDNMSLVNNIARKIANKLGIEIEDAVQYGYEGMIDAVDKFNPNFGFAFSTYAWKAIFRRIDRNSKNDKLFRIPIDKYENLEKMYDMVKLLELETGQDISYGQLLDVINQLKENGDFVKDDDMEVLNMFNSYLEGLGEKALFFGNYDELDSRYLVDEKYILDNIIINKTLKEDLSKILATLTPREEKVLRLRFGLDNGITMSLEDIGQIIGVSGTRISQIQAKALRKLRHPSRSKKLRDYMEPKEGLNIARRKEIEDSSDTYFKDFDVNDSRFVYNPSLIYDDGVELEEKMAFINQDIKCLEKIIDALGEIKDNRLSYEQQIIFIYLCDLLEYSVNTVFEYNNKYKSISNNVVLDFYNNVYRYFTDRNILMNDYTILENDKKMMKLINKLKDSGVPCKRIIVEEAIRREQNGTLDKFINELSDYRSSIIDPRVAGRS